MISPRSVFGLKVKYDPIELMLQRAMLAGFVIYYLAGLPTFSTQPSPNGLAHRLDLTFIHDPRLSGWLFLLLFPAALLSIFGRWSLLGTGYMMAYWVVTMTLVNSQGAIGHGTNMVGLILLAQCAAYGVARLHRLLGQPIRPGTDLDEHDLANYYTIQAIAAAYMVAGISKLIISKGTWIAQLPNIAVVILRNHDQRYYNDFQEGLIERGEMLADLIVRHPTLTTILFSGGLFVELFAFLALIGRRAAFLVGIALYVMHVMISETMKLDFYHNQWMLLIYLINIPFLIVLAGRFASKRYLSPPPSSAA